MFVMSTVHTGNVIRASNFACALPLATMRSIQLVFTHVFTVTESSGEESWRMAEGTQ